MQIGTKNLKTYLIYPLILLGAIGFFIRANMMPENNILKTAKIRVIKSSDEVEMISAKEIYEKLNSLTINDLQKTSVEELDLKYLEELLNKDSRVKNAQLYVDGNKILYVIVNQRKPIVRIESKNNNAYYLDEKMMYVNKEVYSSARVVVATGEIESYSRKTVLYPKSNLNRVFHVAKIIESDEYLKSMIEQIHVRPNRQFILIPKLGNYKIVLSDFEDLESKFTTLKDYYRSKIRERGWGVFDELDMSYANQIIERNNNELQP